MVIYRDTRDKKGKHVNVDSYLERRGHELIYKKLDVGDVMAEELPGVSVDLKRDLGELSTNLMNRKDHSRFYKEVRRARESGVKLYVLCEHGGQVRGITDVAAWSNKYSGVSGRALMEEIYRVHISYGVEFLFCDKRSTGRRILEIFETEATNGRGRQKAELSAES